MKIYNFTRFTGSEHITVSNKNSSFSEFFQLDMPFVFIPVTLNKTLDTATISYISPGEFRQYHSSFTKFISTYNNRPKHRHNYCELLYIIDGTVTQIIDDKEIKFTNNSCCVLNRNINHIEKINNSLKAVLFLFNENYIAKIFNKNSYSKGEFIIYDMLSQNLNSHFLQKQYIEYKKIEPSNTTLNDIKNLTYNNTKAKSIIEQILLELSTEDSGYLLIVEGLILRFFKTLEDENNYNKQLTTLPLGHEETILMEIINTLENEEHRLTRAELENKLNYSGDYINKIVKKHTGLSFINLNKSILLKKSHDLLLNSDMTISEIVELLGYNNRSYFYKIFTEKYGISPGEIKPKS